MSHQASLLPITCLTVGEEFNKFRALGSQQDAARKAFLARCDNATQSKATFGQVMLLNQQIQMITRREVRLPPEAVLQPVTLKIKLQNPIERDAFEGLCGSLAGEPWKFEFRCEVLNIVEAFDRLSGTRPDAPDFTFVGQRFNSLFFKGVDNGSPQPDKINF